ncbi:hypothetical protein RO3G_14160 [Rhizopus delemar RA 99-880]|uniref:Uncharacterized protein n=1 Tax=Rhizopus delemar (strain RA 99-880 / ATCC MYA-4621 / FGSC 9543 / NRRL 43880) TaxID=246409 RepID=I1CLW9_RHIO9|nr:hypothetical protein RO3G_14160 [Rhizopus delemar RA 99-880]|eukprot:EIE89449.1 hypothetical protein RO3G_14160 [Rhizopus delemar RA 99-880]
MSEFMIEACCIAYSFCILVIPWIKFALVKLLSSIAYAIVTGNILGYICS